jgi:hypothetical protein
MSRLRPSGTFILQLDPQYLLLNVGMTEEVQLRFEKFLTWVRATHVEIQAEPHIIVDGPGIARSHRKAWSMTLRHPVIRWRQVNLQATEFSRSGRNIDHSELYVV